MKIKQSETIEINRSEIDFAPYNPRTDSPEVVDEIKKNFKSVGFLGGIVWNEYTGFLVSGHKRIQAMDLIYKYDGTPEKDYKVKVEKVYFDEKTEMEQNIFMNNDAVQAKFDYKKLAVIMPQIDFKKTGLTEFHLDKIKVFQPEIIVNKPAEKDVVKKEVTPESIQSLKDLKHEIKESSYDRHDQLNNSHLTIVFANWDEKVQFCEMADIDIEAKFINYSELLNKITF
jgi:hypothetical protein